MQKAFDEIKNGLWNKAYFHWDNAQVVDVTDAIEIVNQVAEEYKGGWIYLTDDEDSYPKPFEYVLVQDDIGDKNVAYCDPDYDWHISNGESTKKAI